MHPPRDSGQLPNDQIRLALATRSLTDRDRQSFIHDGPLPTGMFVDFDTPWIARTRRGRRLARNYRALPLPPPKVRPLVFFGQFVHSSLVVH